MHRALLLPEIVTAILRAGKTEPGLLYNSLFVNKLFFIEACRILWKGSYGTFDVGHPTPKIRHLANLVLDSPRDRAQFYANFIHVLVFKDGDIGNFRTADDADWHPELCRLHFPRLQDLTICKTGQAERLNTEENILHYVHSGLRGLRVHASGTLSDFFLEELSSRCHQLQQFSIESRSLSISKAGMVCFLQKMSSLESLNVAKMKSVWSAEALTAVSRLERLEVLHVPATQDSSLDKLKSSSTPVLFRALKHFYCSDTTGNTLRWLHEIKPQLETLHVYNGDLGGTEDVLSVAAKFNRLGEFEYQSGRDARVTGHEIAQLAQGCSCLTSLSIAQDPVRPVPAIGMTNSVIDDLARGLPLLKELFLCFDSETRPGIASLLQSFSQYCAKLERLTISCGSDWLSTTSLPQRALFSELWAIFLCPGDHMEQCLSEEEFKTLLDHWKSHAIEWFPKVEFFTIDDADDREQEISDFMWDVSYKREYGSEAEIEEGNDDEEECNEEDQNEQ